jgi:cell wall-associated NlpC family hydrolase
MVGTAYRYGGSDPRGFDCSGLVRYAFGQTGIKLPRSSREIFRSSQVINEADLQPGDLVFFAIRKNRISHVGIYAADGLFIHAPSSGKGVGYASLDDQYWRQRLVGVGRL